MLAGVNACAAAPPSDAWVLTPISYDNALDGAGPRDIIDTAYPMTLVSDTVGGFWGVSSGSWLHIDAAGVAAARFNLFEPGTYGAVAAVSPTVLVVATSTYPHELAGGISIFDTEAGTWRELHRDERGISGITATDRRVYFVAHAASTPTCTVEMLDLRRNSAPEVVAPEFECAGPVAIAADPSRNLFIATDAERIVVNPEGDVRVRVAVASDQPAVSVNDVGDVLWSGQDAAETADPMFIAGGSGDARTIIGRHIACDRNDYELAGRGLESLSLDSADSKDQITWSFLCAPTGLAWINNEEFVVSVGSENGAPLVRVTPPRAAGD